MANLYPGYGIVIPYPSQPTPTVPSSVGTVFLHHDRIGSRSLVFVEARLERSCNRRRPCQTPWWPIRPSPALPASAGAPAIQGHQPDAMETEQSWPPSALPRERQTERSTRTPSRRWLYSVGALRVMVIVEASKGDSVTTQACRAGRRHVGRVHLHPWSGGQEAQGVLRPEWSTVVNKAAFFISIPDNNTHTSGEFVAFRLLQLNFLDFCHRLRKRVKRPHDFESSARA